MWLEAQQFLINCGSKMHKKIYCLSPAFFYLTIRDFGTKIRRINEMTRNSKR